MFISRRDFLSTISFGYAGLKISTDTLLSDCGSCAGTTAGNEYDVLVKELLTRWCDGMMKHQIHAPDDPKLHGALMCPACNLIHGRCMDAVYPFLHMAHITGEKRYLDAGIDVFEWSKNVTLPDGSWSNDLNPKSWRGTTIFGAIALAEALHYHGELLDSERLARWKDRLDQAAGGYLYTDFDELTFTNVNYGFTAVYGFHLLGRILKKQKYFDRSRELAKGVKKLFTEPNKLLFGEGKPYNKGSGRGLLPVDLGYNVEESLNGVVLYALEENDLELQQFLVEAMNGHLEFMLPDGAWDNSWGTRQAKWSYWGSRTSDGCQPAFSLMANFNPAFGTAAYKNTELLARCTADGLLHGGPHYVSHGIKPCIHHTFAHAKVLALLQDRKHELPKIDKSTPLPRDIAAGVKHFPELNVWLAARGPWRATVSAYDSLYAREYTKYIQQATGGSLAVLYHNKVGTLFAASMAEYILVEERNQQLQPGQEFALTPRVETLKDGTWYTNLWDLTADVEYSDDFKIITFDVKTTLQDKDRQPLKDDVSGYDINYLFEDSKVTITAKSSDGMISISPSALILPVLSPTGEAVRQVSANRIEIVKPGGTVVVESSVPLFIKRSEKGRIFNMVPGMESLPIIAQLPNEKGMKAECSISVL